MTTKIEWADEVWNVTTGCDQISAGCDNCYAKSMASRLRGMGQPKYQKDGAALTSGPGFGVTEHPAELDRPWSWSMRRPRRIFVDSMGDLFHGDVSDGFIGSVWNTMALTPWHTYLVLTKRPARARSLLTAWANNGWSWRDHKMRWVGPVAGPLPNVWIGTSVEDQKRADLRVPVLLDVPAARRFLSCEPLLGPVELIRTDPWWSAFDVTYDEAGIGTGGIDWVIAGGESGPRARPMHPDWARSLRDQCTVSGVPYFLKQWGEWGPAPWTLPVCDPADGWGNTGTDAGLARAKVDSEKRGATHCVRPDGSLYDPKNKPWSLERVGTQSGAVRRWGTAHSGRMLDGRTWDEVPDPVVPATVPA